MASLSDSIKLARKGLVVFVIGFLSCGVIGLVRLNTTQPQIIIPQITADNRFGDLPKLDLKDINYSYKDSLNFELVTTDGELPSNLPEIAYVYKFIIPKQSLTSKQSAVSLANNLGFKGAPKIESNRYYTWASSDGNQVLKYDSLVKELSLTTDLAKDSRIFQDHLISSSDDVYVRGFKNYVSSIPSLSLTDDYSSGTVSISYLNFESGKFVPAVIEASSRTNFVELSLSRYLPVVYYEIPSGSSDDLSQYISEKNYVGKVMSLDPSKAYIRAIVGGSVVNSTSVFDLVVKPKPIDYNDLGAYKIKKVEQAYKELLAGDAYLVYMSDYELNKTRTVKSFLIDKIKIAYYEQDDYKSYVQPMYVFEGVINFTDNRRADFFFYLPAIED